jgi:hypothetical protein
MGSGRSANQGYNQGFPGYQGYGNGQQYCQPKPPQMPIIYPIPIPYPMPMPMQMPMQQPIQYCCPPPQPVCCPQPIQQQRQCTSITYCC